MKILTSIFSLGVILFLYVAPIESAVASSTLETQHIPSQRIVSIDGSITEIIYALGMEHTLVGVDSTSRFPAPAQRLPNVGYMRQLSAEGILSLKPDRVIASAEAGPIEILNQLNAAGLKVDIIKSQPTLEGVYNKISAVGELLNAGDQAQTFIQSLEKNISQLKSKFPTHTSNPPPKVLFLLAAGNHGVMLAGKNTQADAMISLMGGSNVVTDFTSYKPLTPEGGLQISPDIIVIANTQSSFPVLEMNKLLQLTPAAKNQKVVQADSMLLLGFGPRIDQAISVLAPVFYD